MSFGKIRARFSLVKVLTAFLIALVGFAAACVALLTWFEVIPGTRSGSPGDEILELVQEKLDEGFLSDASPIILVSPDPASEPSAPLRDVDITAAVPTGITGDITYRFDCTDDGTWEKTATSSSTRFTAVDLCDYPDPGTYAVRVQVETADSTLEDTVDFVVSEGTALSVDFRAIPSSGPAPLNGIDFIAVVSGTVTGDITFQVDCDGDGSWEWEETTSSARSTEMLLAEDVCDYPYVGIYGATMRVERENLSFQGTHGIFVEPSG